MSVSPVRDTSSPYQSPKPLRRFPPKEQQWKETLRSGKKPTKTAKKQTELTQSVDLNELIAASIAQLKASREERKEVTRKSEGSSLAKGASRDLLKDAKNVDLLLKAAEDVKLKWAQRQSLSGGPATAMTPTSRKQLVQRMIERTMKKSGGRETLSQIDISPGIDTEPSPTTLEEDYSQYSPQRITRTEESPPVRESFTPKSEPATVKQLKEEISTWREKHRKVEALYAALLSRSEDGQRNDYRRLYEDLKYQHEKEQVQSIQKQWQSQFASLRHELESRTSECQRLREQLARTQPLDLSTISHLQQEVEDMKLRVTKTERDNEYLRQQLR